MVTGCSGMGSTLLKVHRIHGTRGHSRAFTYFPDRKAIGSSTDTGIGRTDSTHLRLPVILSCTRHLLKSPQAGEPLTSAYIPPPPGNRLRCGAFDSTAIATAIHEEWQGPWRVCEAPAGQARHLR